MNTARMSDDNRCEECAARLSDDEAARHYGPSEEILCSDCAYVRFPDDDDD